MQPHEFVAIYDEHVWRVYGFFAYRLNSRQDAEDLTQQTFERAWRAAGRYDPLRGTVSAWLVAIARNQLIDHLRSRAAAPQLPVEAVDLETFAAPPEAYGIGIEPDLELALSTLSSRERELIALRFGGDLSGPEIAELTGLSLANVQQILSRALRSMRATLDGGELGARRSASPQQVNAR
jgi:RNA polymerase sigma-70 factor (ECF subfamily)